MPEGGRKEHEGLVYARACVWTWHTYVSHEAQKHTGRATHRSASFVIGFEQEHGRGRSSHRKGLDGEVDGLEVVGAGGPCEGVGSMAQGCFLSARMGEEGLYF